MSNKEKIDEDKIFDERFNFILEDITKNHKDLTNYLATKEQEVDAKFTQFTHKLNEHINKQCKDKLEKLMVYADFDKKFLEVEGKSSPVHINNLQPARGYDKEFARAMHEMNSCKQKYEDMGTELMNDAGILSTLALASKTECLNQCKLEVRQHKQSEYDARRCISACFRYVKTNMDSFSIIMEENIVKKMNFI